MKKMLISFLILMNIFGYAQQKSVHEEQSDFYKAIGAKSDKQYDSINGYAGR